MSEKSISSLQTRLAANSIRKYVAQIKEIRIEKQIIFRQGAGVFRKWPKYIPIYPIGRISIYITHVNLTAVISILYTIIIYRSLIHIWRTGICRWTQTTHGISNNTKSHQTKILENIMCQHLVFVYDKFPMFFSPEILNLLNNVVKSEHIFKYM